VLPAGFDVNVQEYVNVRPFVLVLSLPFSVTIEPVDTFWSGPALATGPWYLVAALTIAVFVPLPSSLLPPPHDMTRNATSIATIADIDKCLFLIMPSLV